jgi:SAM-dependent methyltransferase
MREAGRLTTQPLQLRPGARLLDLGGGTGEVAMDLTAADSIMAVCTDKSEHMVRLCPAGIAGCVGAAELLPFRSQCFDAVILNLVVPYLTSVRSAFDEIHRVLAHNGALVCSDWSRRDWPPAMEIWRRVAERQGWRESESGHRVNRKAAASLASGVAEAGFCQVNVTEQGYEYDWTPSGFVAARLASTAGRHFVRSRSHQQVIRTIEEFAQCALEGPQNQYVERGLLAVCSARR